MITKRIKRMLPARRWSGTRYPPGGISKALTWWVGSTNEFATQRPTWRSGATRPAERSSNTWRTALCRCNLEQSPQRGRPGACEAEGRHRGASCTHFIHKIYRAAQRPMDDTGSTTVRVNRDVHRRLKALAKGKRSRRPSIVCSKNGGGSFFVGRTRGLISFDVAGKSGQSTMQRWRNWRARPTTAQRHIPTMAESGPASASRTPRRGDYGG